MKLRVQLVKELDDDGKQEQIVDQFETNDLDAEATHAPDSVDGAEVIFDGIRDHLEKLLIDLYEVD